MKKLLLISMLIGAMSLPALAQVDDLYYVPKKKTVEKVTDNYGMPKDTYYSGSDRSVDDYNRRESSYEVIGDSLKSDVIDLTAEQGVYPDSLEDFQLTKKMTRFDDYELSDNAAFWAGYAAGRYDWGWHSPWYYSRFGWYGGWYDPWYYGYYGWGYPYRYYGYYRPYPIYYGGSYTQYSPRYRSPRQSFGTGRNRFGTSGRNTAGRGSFGGSYGSRVGSTSSTRMPGNNGGSFGASRSSGSSGSFGGGGRSGGGSFGGGGGGGRSGGGGGFGRHR